MLKENGQYFVLRILYVGSHVNVSVVLAFNDVGVSHLNVNYKVR